MYNPSLKPILIGIGVGIVLFALPFFLFKAMLIFLVFGFIFRMVSRRMYPGRHARTGLHSRGYGRWRYAASDYGAELHPAFADTIRNMSEEEYGTFRQKLVDDRPAHSATEYKTTIEIQ